MSKVNQSTVIGTVDAPDRVTDQPQRTIVVLGMHRSGTSALAGSLEEAGVYLGDVSVSNPGNAKGNRETRVVMGLLEANGGSWDNPPEMVEWDEPSRAVLRSFVSSFADPPVWGFKDVP